MELVHKSFLIVSGLKNLSQFGVEQRFESFITKFCEHYYWLYLINARIKDNICSF